MNFLRNKEATCYTKFERSWVSAGFVVNQFICLWCNHMLLKDDKRMEE